MRNLPPTELLTQLPPLQQLLERLMCALPRGAASRHYVVQAALLTVAKESFQVPPTSDSSLAGSHRPARLRSELNCRAHRRRCILPACCLLPRPGFSSRGLAPSRAPVSTATSHRMAMPEPHGF